jgi:hypothetical protein
MSVTLGENLMRARSTSVLVVYTPTESMRSVVEWMEHVSDEQYAAAAP